MSSGFFRIYAHDDVLGVEIAGAIKNILAIGAGLLEGSGLGYNAKSGMVARGTQEMYKFAKNYGKTNPKTFGGLSGVGDLMLTSFGGLSRNRTFGMRLA